MKAKHKGTGPRLFPYLMTSPYFIIYFVFGMFPILYTLYLSFFEWNGVSEKIYVGLANYKTLLLDGLFHKTLLNTAILALFILPFQLFFGFMIARILTSKFMPLKNLFRLANFLPYITNAVAVGLVFSVLFTWQRGPINEILKFFGLIQKDIFWTGQEWPARALVAIMMVWREAGYTALFFMAGIMNVDPGLFEAAEIDGANAFQKTIYITIPMLKSVFRFVVLTSIIGLLQLFDALFALFSGVASNALVMTGGPNNAVLTTVWYLYSNGFGSVTRMGYASTIAYGLFAVILIITLVTNRALFKSEDQI